MIDFDGGFIETNLIMKENINQRCLIKVIITSRELISNGVSNKIICETKNDEWLSSNKTLDAEKSYIKIYYSKRPVTTKS